MIPKSGLMAAVLGLAMAGQLAQQRPLTEEQEARRQKAELERLAREEHRNMIAARRHKTRTGGSLLDKARRAKGRI